MGIKLCSFLSILYPSKVLLKLKYLLKSIEINGMIVKAVSKEDGE